MSERLLKLAARIRDELLDLSQVVERAQEGWRRAQQSGDDYYLTFNFDPAKVQRLAKEAPTMFAQARVELLAFADFLEQQAQVSRES